MAKANLSTALEFIKQADSLGFRYFVNGFDQLAFHEGPDWQVFGKLRDKVLPLNLSMKEALADLGRIEPPAERWIDLSKCRLIAA